MTGELAQLLAHECLRFLHSVNGNYKHIKEEKTLQIARLYVDVFTEVSSAQFNAVPTNAEWGAMRNVNE